MRDLLLDGRRAKARLVGRDGRAFDADAMLADGIGGIDGDAVVGLVAFLDRKIIIFQVDFEISTFHPIQNGNE